MPNDRLTIAAARLGMRVRLVDLSPFPDGGEVPLSPWRDYVIAGVSKSNKTISLDGVEPWFQVRRFVLASEPTLAALLSERAPEFLAAVREWHRICSSWVHFGSPSGRALYEAIERAGLIAQEPSQPFHLTPQQFQEMWNAG